MVVHYGTATPDGDAAMQKKIYFDQFPQLENKRLLFYLGRIHEKKGIDLLIQAFGRLINDASRPLDDNVNLVIAGPCANERYLQSLKELINSTGPGIAKRIYWTGMIQGDIKWGGIHAANAFILPSHQENFGIAVVEALATATPVLISNKVNIWREIEEECAGYVENDTLDGCEKLIRRWLETNPEDWKSHGKNARYCYEKYFDVELAAQSLIQVLNSPAQD